MLRVRVKIRLSSPLAGVLPFRLIPFIRDTEVKGLGLVLGVRPRVRVRVQFRVS